MSSLSGHNTSGVEQLLARIRDEGVSAARQEAERILTEARDEAASTRERARTEAAAILQGARDQAAVEQQSGHEALRLAARDTLLELRATIRRAFEEYVGTLVTRETADSGFMRDLILVIAGEAAEKFLRNKSLQVLVNADLLGSAKPALESALEQLLAERARELGSEMLRRGIELFPARDPSGGARVRLVGENLELDLSDAAISRMLLRFLLPRHQHIISQATPGP